MAVAITVICGNTETMKTNENLYSLRTYENDYLRNYISDMRLEPLF